MNGLLYDAYWTIHITPESHCSYASFETNVRMRDYNSLVRAVLAIFRPKRFTMTLFADEQGLAEITGGTASAFPMVLAVPITKSSETSGGGGGGAAVAACIVLPDGNTSLPRETSNNSTNNEVDESAKSTLPTTTDALPPRSASSALHYVQTHKSSSMFLGYSSFMGNYFMVHAEADSNDETADAVATAATSLLAMPRAKYNLPACVKTTRKRYGSVSL